MIETRALWNLNSIRMRARDQKIYSIPDLEIKKGEHVALVGENRELRRAMFRLLAGLEVPLEGHCLIEGVSLLPTRPMRHPWRDPVPQSTRRKMGVSLEKDGLLSNVSLRENMETLFRFKYGDHNSRLKEGASRATQETAVKMGLNDETLNKRPSDLSPLERRLASLALAFMTKPSILMLENPALGLNDEAWTVLSKVLESILKGSQRTFIMDTDDWLLARAHADRWLVCDHSGHIQSVMRDEYVLSNPDAIRKILQTEKHLGWMNWLKDLERGVA